MFGIDLQNPKGARRDPPMLAQQALGVHIQSVVGGDETRRAVGQPVADPNVLRAVFEREFEERHQPFGADIVGVASGVRSVWRGDRQILEVGCAPRHGFERDFIEGTERIDPEIVNRDALGEGWLFKIKLDDTSEASKLMDESSYEDYIAGLDD